MSFQQFSSKQYIKVVETNENPTITSFTVPANQLISASRVKLFIRNLQPTTQTLQLEIYSDAGLTTLIDTSDTINVVDVIDTTHWFGWVRLNFNRRILKTSETYYVRAVLNNYTRVGDSFMALALDFLGSTYFSGGSFTGAPCAFELYGEPL